ncbi:tubulin-tyrosine ligase family protein, putative [Ichthyophthirius multifiliis]|uniref:Tubulin-tyrosine ligase family protein, putative n=1 Tax=Ichthyophthirius multifiliis TaxID=5932 RepID=G0QVI4_ICHMU|nr:tubulin-tyrosine ligase family protein, putative [Ichthyophthirius multifiliis]EGR30770.1 tubulin-tyrosine ligase family protein, putative [Ichthyophthirius multifiliis]|eukprot:XP_004032357.1 tubulin-tyrosine ligase family protein, putative [Ichthyophthirius multifiliis]
MQVLNIVGKKDVYLHNLNNKKQIRTFFEINEFNVILFFIQKQKQKKHIRKKIQIIQKTLFKNQQKHQQLKENINIEKSKKIFQQKLNQKKQKKRFNFLHSAQLKSINYDVKKRLNQISQYKVQLQNYKSKEECESSDDEPKQKQQSQIYQQNQITDLTKWKKANKIDQKQKVFILKGGYQDLKKALKERDWVENTDYFSPCFDFKWTTKVSDIDYNNLYDFQYVNHFDNNSAFTSKYGIGRSLKTLIHQENIDAYTFFPRSFDLGDLQEFEDFIENFKFTKNQEIFPCINSEEWEILFLSRGRGIKCFNNLDKIFDYIVGKETQFVVQKYIERPLLISNKKFDVRQWAIIQDYCPLKIWFYDECYLRFCSVDHNIDDLNNRFVHLTNNAIQKFNKDGDLDKDELMWRQYQFAEYLKEQNNGEDIFFNQIQPKLKQIIIYSLKSCQDQVSGRKNSMELVGYDFMIDSQYQPWLIEINSSPSMDYSTSITKDLVQRVLKDTVKVVVDYSMAKKGTKKLVDTGGFKLIYKGDKNQNNNFKNKNTKN